MMRRLIFFLSRNLGVIGMTDEAQRGRPVQTEITPELIERIKEMRLSGTPKKQIAGALHIGVARLEHVLFRLGLTRRTVPERKEWTDEDIALLRALWEKGYSGTQISMRFGGKFSRSAVLGKAMRLGLPHRNSDSRESWDGSEDNIKKATQRPSISSRRRSRIVVENIEPLTIDGRSIGVMDLEPHMCRWPHGDPGTEGFCFCGRDRARGKPYCAAHAALSEAREYVRRERVRQKIPLAFLRSLAA